MCDETRFNESMLKGPGPIEVRLHIIADADTVSNYIFQNQISYWPLIVLMLQNYVGNKQLLLFDTLIKRTIIAVIPFTP